MCAEAPGHSGWTTLAAPLAYHCKFARRWLYWLFNYSLSAGQRLIRTYSTQAICSMLLSFRTCCRTRSYACLSANWAKFRRCSLECRLVCAFVVYNLPRPPHTVWLTQFVQNITKITVMFWICSKLPAAFSMNTFNFLWISISQEQHRALSTKKLAVAHFFKQEFSLGLKVLSLALCGWK